MRYLLQDSFLEAAYRLPKDQARKVWKALRLFSRDPDHPGLHYENLRGKAKRLRSLRVDDKYRIILGLTSAGTTLYYVGPEEEAYRLAARIAPAPTRLTSLKPVTPSAVTPSPLPEEVVGDLLIRTVKYLPLGRHLLSVPGQTRWVELSFSSIEKLIGACLPAAARRHRAWWSNSRARHVQAAAWLAVGWRVARVDLKAENVTFARAETAGLQDPGS